uniref:SHOCT domain-containing protein n=1 Tax=Roseihalotalea indica TaxID=2867963 RepID=A0AA49GTC1_9BACT|nr:SHOCT domain-containing protein [Tunicatimonas sp. TK19036]
MHFYDGHFWGMHLIWWVVWVILLIWIFLTPWDLPGQRIRKETPLNLLKKRYAKGEITKEEFEEIKRDLQK